MQDLAPLLLFRLLLLLFCFGFLAEASWMCAGLTRHVLGLGEHRG